MSRRYYYHNPNSGKSPYDPDYIEGYDVQEYIDGMEWEQENREDERRCER